MSTRIMQNLSSLKWLRHTACLAALSLVAMPAFAKPAAKTSDALLKAENGSGEVRHFDASGTDRMTEGARQCTHFMPRYEKQYGIPVHLLAAIASTESGRWHEKLRLSLPWPWTINANGKSYYYSTKEEAVGAARRMISAGTRSIDVGCMQVNLQHHPRAFSSLSEAFEPEYNVAYAATFLRSLYDEQHSWHGAAAAYHSKTPELGMEYVGQVYDRWNTILERIRASRVNLARSMGAVPANEGLTRAEVASAREAALGANGGGDVRIARPKTSSETVYVIKARPAKAKPQQFADASRDTGPLLIRAGEQIKLSTPGAPPIPDPVSSVKPVAMPRPVQTAYATPAVTQQVVEQHAVPAVTVQAVAQPGVRLADASAVGSISPSSGEPAPRIFSPEGEPRKQGPHFIFND